MDNQDSQEILMRILFLFICLALPLNCYAEQALGAAEIDKLLCSITQSNDALQLLGSWGELEKGPSNANNKSYEVKTDKFKISYYLEKKNTEFTISIKKASTSEADLLNGNTEVNAYAADITERLRPLSSEINFPRLVECTESFCKAKVFGNTGWQMTVEDYRVYLNWEISKASLNKVFCK